MIDVCYLFIVYDESLVLIDLNFCVRKGVILGIVGVGGVGKSVLLKFLCGLIKFDDGEVWVDGNHLVVLDEDGMVELCCYMGMLF